MSRPRIATLVTTFAGLLALTAVLGILAFPMSGTAWAAGAKPVHIQGDIKQPQFLRAVSPTYPAEEKLFQVEGRVTSEIVINEEGKVVSVEVKKSSGNVNLDNAAVDALWQWTFFPATLDGKPIAVFYHMSLDFEVD